VGLHRTALALAALIALGVPGAAKDDRRTQADPQFDFTPVRTWGWDASGAGDVKMARASGDDPAPIKKRIEPVIMASVGQEMERRRLTAATDGQPDLAMHYYVLITVGTQTQDMGQFLPSITAWGVPPFVPQATSYDIIQTGSLVLDALSPKAGHVVWRGIAQEQIDKIKNDEERDSKIRKAVRDLIGRLPVKR
jgi:hypothetical protein